MKNHCKARIQITDALARFARGVDQRDWDLAKSAYHHDALDDHRGYEGNIDGLLINIAQRHAQYRSVFHMIGQSLITFVDDTSADVDTYVLIGHITRKQGKVRLAAGRWIDRFTFRGGEWRIQRRTVADSNWNATIQDPSRRPKGGESNSRPR